MVYHRVKTQSWAARFYSPIGTKMILLVLSTFHVFSMRINHQMGWLSSFNDSFENKNAGQEAVRHNLDRISFVVLRNGHRVHWPPLILWRFQKTFFQRSCKNVRREMWPMWAWQKALDRRTRWRRSILQAWVSGYSLPARSVVPLWTAWQCNPWRPFWRSAWHFPCLIQR